MYVSCGSLDNARKVFDEMSKRDFKSWAIMIAGYADNGEHKQVIRLFVNDKFRYIMYSCGSFLVSWIMVYVLKACGETMNVKLGEEVHGWLMKSRYRVFDQIGSRRNVVVWTARIINNCKEERFREVFKVFNEMGKEGVRKNSFTLSSVLSACSKISNDGKCGEQVHANVIKLGLASKSYVQYGLVNMYGKFGLINDAKRVFNMKESSRKHACWNDMLTSLVQNGCLVEAIKFLYQMRAAVAQTTTNDAGTSTTLIPGPVTTEEKAQKKNDIKARTFVTSPSTNSTNEVPTAYGVSTASTQSSTASTKNQDSSKRTVNVEETPPKAMVAIDGVGFDWSYMAEDEVPTNMDLMAFSDSKGAGFESYNAFPPPPTGLFSPPKTDLSYYGLEEFQQPEFERYGPKSCKIESKNASENVPNKLKESTEVKESSDVPLVKKLVSDAKLEKKTVILTDAKIEFDKAKQHEKPINTARPRPVNTARPRPVNTARPRPVNTVRPRPVNTARPNSKVVNDVRVNKVNAVKASSCWVCRPTKPNGGSITLKRHNYIDVRDSSRNMSYLLDFKEFNRGYVTFRGKANGAELLVKELFTLMCDKKNNVLFTDTECLVLSPNFKLPDENQILLRVPRRRLCHINFKNINKLVKDNLVRGLPSKRFKNDQTSVGCLKGKQHKASSTKDETLGIFKKSITKIENLVDKKVKVIRCDNETEFKNSVINDFYAMKGIRKEFNVAKTPQQNSVTERRNWILIEAARTIKAFRVDNFKTKKVKENLHIRFLEDNPSIVGNGPKWLFDIDVITNLMNYVPVIVEPTRVAKALTDPAWVKAMQEELLQFKLQKVWILVDLPKGKKAIGINYDEVFAPVARIEAIRLFLAYASFMGFMVYQMDVKSAFLYRKIEEEVYVDDIIFGSTKKKLCD
nr:hypothetical protein [Tanacetum cinerariifolium]